MKELGDLPPWAIVVFAITLAFIYAARYFGLSAGKAAAKSPDSGAAVAAVIVDPKPLTRSSEAGERLADRIQDLSRVTSENSNALCRRIESLDDTLADLNRSVKDLSADLRRR